MTRRTDADRTDAALRALDPAVAPILTEEERRGADATLARILDDTASAAELGRTVVPHPRRRRLLVPAALLTGAIVAATAALGSGPAFADWTAIPTTLPPGTASAAAATCRSGLDIRDPMTHVAVGERRGGWTYVLIDGSQGEGACLMPDDLVGTDGAAARGKGFFGSYDPEHPQPPTPARDGLVETESAVGTVTVHGRLPLTRTSGAFVWVTGYAGGDVTRVTVDPPTGRDVVASLRDGRFVAWWPAGEARLDNPGMTGAWSYTVTLADGTTRRI